MKKTVLYDTHVNLGAKMVDFAGFQMPVSYSGIIEEHHAVRQAAGLFDVSHMGEFLISGKDAKAFLQFATANDVEKLSPGKAQYSYIPNDKGGIVDDIIIYQLDDAQYFMVVNASNIEKDFDWLNKQTEAFEVTLENQSDAYALLALQGPKAQDILNKLTNSPINLTPFTFEMASLADQGDILVSATGYTGAGGYELYIPSDSATQVWNALLDAGKEEGLLPVGLGARDSLRLEVGYNLYGNDIDDTTNPIEAGLGWVTKKIPFQGSDLIRTKEGTKKRLIGLVLEGKGVPRAGHLVLSTDEKEIGKLTSGGFSPLLQKGVGLAYVAKEHLKDEKVLVDTGRRKMEATLQKPPFIN